MNRLRAALRSSRKLRGVATQDDAGPSNRECHEGDDHEGDDHEDDEHEEAAEENDPTQEGSQILTDKGRVWTPRGPTTVPAAPSTPGDRKILVPMGPRSWRHVPYSKKERNPNNIIGALCRHYYPQTVYDGSLTPPALVPATLWKHWYSAGEEGNTMADRVKNDFCARYTWPPDKPELQQEFAKTLENCCIKLAKQQMYLLRVRAVQSYYAEILKEPLTSKAAMSIKLTASQYEQVPFTWVDRGTWSLLSAKWGSAAWQQQSDSRCNSRRSKPHSVNHRGSSSIQRTIQDMELTYGKEFGLIEAYSVHGGATRAEVANLQSGEMPNVQNPMVQENLEVYRDGMVKTHGEGVDWVHGPFDAQVMYDCTGGKPKGRYAIGDGAFDSSNVKHSTTPRSTPAFSVGGRERERELERRVEQLAAKARESEEREKSLQHAITSLTQWMQSQNPNGPPPPMFNWGGDPFSTPPASTSAQPLNAQDSTDAAMHRTSDALFGRTVNHSNCGAGGSDGNGGASGGLDDWFNSPSSRH